MTASSSLSFAGQEVQRLDRDRFATAMLAAADRRNALLGLYAFNAEVAQIRELVSQPMLGRIRLQWWRDTIAVLHEGGSVAHPVAAELERAVKAFGLSSAPFDRLLDSREADFEEEPPADLASLEDYAEGTAGSLNVLALEILDVRGDVAVGAAQHLGTAWALVGLLRAVPFHASAGRLYLPADLMDEHGVRRQDVLAGRDSPGLAKLAEIVAERGRRHLETARQLQRDIPRRGVPALLTGALAEGYLDLLRKARFNLFDGAWSAPRPQPLKLIWAMLRGRV